MLLCRVIAGITKRWRIGASGQLYKRIRILSRVITGIRLSTNHRLCQGLSGGLKILTPSQSHPVTGINCL